MLATALAAVLLIAPPPAAPRAAAPSAAPPVAWVIDPSHSELNFRIRHFVSRVNGTFRRWKGTIVADPANLAEGASVEVEIETASIDTRHEKRDTHLRSAEFFDAANHPAITFRSRSVTVEGHALRIAGDLTIRGVTRPVVLEGEYVGTTGTADRQRLGFTATPTVNRMDYGVSWNRAAEGGGMMLGDEVTIELSVAAVRAPAT